MMGDSAPHCVFKISELSRDIASQLIYVSQKSTLNLACTSRYLEEPVLSTLWETQRRLSTLLKVLPEGTWKNEYIESKAKWEVRGLDLPLEIPNAQIGVALV